jgi:hypothetical protein
MCKFCLRVHLPGIVAHVLPFAFAHLACSWVGILSLLQQI